MLTTPSRRLSSTLFLAFAYFALAACGGSSGGGTPPVVTPPDTSPTPFTFAVVDDVDPGAKAVSETITIEGIDADVSVTVTVENGQYRLNDGEFQSESADASLGDELTLQGTASETPEETETVTVTVGDHTTTFDVVAGSDTEAPDAAFVFPPPMTATEGDTVIVRGTAEDEWSEVNSVTLTVTHADSTNDYEVDTEDGFATWQKQVTLAPGENIITIQAEDSLGNKVDEDDQQSVTVVRQEFSEAFPDDEVAIELPQSLVFDEEHDRILVTDLASNRVVAVDLTTGIRSVFLQMDEGNEVISDNPSGLLMDEPRNRLLVGGRTIEGGSVLGVDLETKEVSLISSEETPSEDQPPFYNPKGMVVDPSDSDQVFVLASGTRNLSRLNLINGERELVSSNDIAESGPEFDAPTQVLIDNIRNRALVGQSNSDSLLSVNLDTGVREVYLAEGTPEETPQTLVRALVSDDIAQRILAFEGYSRSLWSVDVDSREITTISGADVPHSHNPLGRFIDMDLAMNGEFVVGVDLDVSAIYAIDLTTGERLVISKPAAEFPF